MISNRLEIPVTKRFPGQPLSMAKVRKFRQFHANSGNELLPTAQWAAGRTVGGDTVRGPANLRRG